MTVSLGIEYWVGKWLSSDFVSFAPLSSNFQWAIEQIDAFLNLSPLWSSLLLFLTLYKTIVLSHGFHDDMCLG